MSIQHHNFLTTKKLHRSRLEPWKTRDEKTCPPAWQSEPSTPPSEMSVCLHTRTRTRTHSYTRRLHRDQSAACRLVQPRWRITGYARWHWSTGLSAPVDSLTRSSPRTFVHNCFTLCFTRRLDPFCLISLVSFCVFVFFFVLFLLLLLCCV